MTPSSSQADRCLASLDKLVRAAEHELDSLRGELLKHRREHAQLTERRKELAQQAEAALDTISLLQGAPEGMDLAAIERQRAWVRQLQSAAQRLLKLQEELERSIAELVARMEYLQRRVRVLQKARERRAQRLARDQGRRGQRDADEQHLLRGLGGMAA